jgi:hypothetical protein
MDVYSGTGATTLRIQVSQSRALTKHSVYIHTPFGKKTHPSREKATPSLPRPLEALNQQDQVGGGEGQGG